MQECALKNTDRSEELNALLAKDIPLAALKSVQDVVFLSIRATEKAIPAAIEHLAKVANRLHEKYGINGFLANCGVMQLAGRDSVMGLFPLEDVDFIFSTEPIFCVYSFPRVTKECEDARIWARSINMGGMEASIGPLTLGLMKW